MNSPSQTITLGTGHSFSQAEETNTPMESVEKTVNTDEVLEEEIQMDLNSISQESISDAVQIESQPNRIQIESPSNRIQIDLESISTRVTRKRKRVLSPQPTVQPRKKLQTELLSVPVYRANNSKKRQVKGQVS